MCKMTETAKSETASSNLIVSNQSLYSEHLKVIDAMQCGKLVS